MGCHYPSCMMGGGSCDYEVECEENDRKAKESINKQKELDREEQMARIAWFKAQTEALTKETK